MAKLNQKIYKLFSRRYVLVLNMYFAEGQNKQRDITNIK